MEDEKEQLNKRIDRMQKKVSPKNSLSTSLLSLTFYYIVKKTGGSMLVSSSKN